MANTGSNHNLVLAKIRQHIHPVEQNKKSTIEKLNIELLSDKTTKYLYQQRLTQKSTTTQYRMRMKWKPLGRNSKRT